MNAQKFDVVIIGGGPAGYVAAIRAAQLGFKVACVDKRGNFGGTCLNVGCIPSKALLHASHRYSDLSQLKTYGISVSGASYDLKALMAYKDKVVTDLTKGISYLFSKNKVIPFSGEAKVLAPGIISVKTDQGTQEIQATHIVLATGSEPVPLPGTPFDETHILSSTGALALSETPKHLVVVGGGYIGIEMASVWCRLGAQVTVVEYLDQIVPGMDHEVGASLLKTLKGQGISFALGTKVTAVEKTEAGVQLSLQTRANGQETTLDASALLVAIGRRPYTEGLGLDELGVVKDGRGFIQVDRHFQTTVPGIYAIGDVIPGPMLAHKGEEEGVVLMEILAGQSGHVNYKTIPGVVYTHPEAASVGKTEQQLKEEGVDYRVGKFPFMANSRARAVSEKEGFVKILVDGETDRVLGVHILGPEAGTLIAEAVLALEYGASSEDIARTCHAHPTLNEAVKEAALDALGRVVHM